MSCVCKQSLIDDRTHIFHGERLASVEALAAQKKASKAGRILSANDRRDHLIEMRAAVLQHSLLCKQNGLN